MKQHYIPRCYLKRFSNNERSIFTYDKCKSESYNTYSGRYPFTFSGEIRSHSRWLMARS